MVAVPVLTPLTTPDVELTLAMPEALLAHVPPVGVELNVVVEPIQTDAVPVIAVGEVLTVTVATDSQPVPREYVIFAVPAATPDTTPVVEFTVAVPVAPLVHIPPVGEQLNVVVDPVQTVRVPVIAPGAAVTVILFVTKQPAGSV